MILNQTMAIVASSSMVVREDSAAKLNETTGAIQYFGVENETLSVNVRDSVQRRFGGFEGVGGSQRYQDDVMGDTWIVSLQIVKFSDYPDGNLLLAAAMKRSDVFGRIDTATTKSTLISLGISVTMCIIITLVFIMVVLPLSKLSKAMATLTKLDFGSLEEGRVLTDRSVIGEVYKMQVTFGTMVKAFAVAIKKNRELTRYNGPSNSSFRNKPGTGSTTLPSSNEGSGNHTRQYADNSIKTLSGRRA
ncbi:hypothetical protein HK104_010671 [Borealophlyctis nickersoniae]|nr:hypothetical protein HK104_010671 [Borealophlyctis nickersoniae]